VDISPLCDRFKSDMEQGQAGFIKFVVFPTFQTWVKIVPAAEVALKYLKQNLDFWNDKANSGLLRAASVRSSLASSRRSSQQDVLLSPSRRSTEPRIDLIHI